MIRWKLVPVEADREAIDPAFERTRYDAGYSSHVELANALVAAAPSPPEDVLERMAEVFLMTLYGNPASSRAEAMRSALAAAQGTDDAR